MLTRKASKSKKHDSSTVAKWSVIAVICLAIVTVVAYGIFAMVYDEEKIVKTDLDTIASNYYEEYLYSSLMDEHPSQAQIEHLMARYINRGFGRVHLRQLLLRANKNQINFDRGLILKHCDENNTIVRFYPEPPYNKKSYRIEYQYDCDF